MTCDATLSPASIPTTHYAPYNASLASSASTSTSSVWSDTSSQNSDDTSASVHSSDSDSCESFFSAKASAADRVLNFRRHAQKTQAEAVPAELRQNPRRTSNGPKVRPSLVRQSDRKVNFVDSLVGTF
jgi:hypothetical protein